MKNFEEIKSICKAACEHMEHSCREPCPCGYCRILAIIWEMEKEPFSALRAMKKKGYEVGTISECPLCHRPITAGLPHFNCMDMTSSSKTYQQCD
jgi:hypothetical protein